MKLDGHAKITNKAIVKFKARVNREPNRLGSKKISQASTFNTWDVKWSGTNSNTLDNAFLSAFVSAQELSILREELQPLKKGYLTREVVAVDLEPSKLPAHFTDTGQKYHFLRRDDLTVSVKDAHKECSDFIYEHAVQWIRHTISFSQNYSNILRYNVSPLTTGMLINIMQRNTQRRAASELALALHALQDSFSSGHTLRADYIDMNRPGAIEDIYVYAEQDKHKHGEKDYLSASENSILYHSAIAASSELMYICVRSVAKKSVAPQGWEDFKNKWLKFSQKAK